ncbi:DNA polymerase III subunit gamma/tau [Marinomonas posidonica]|uniref:DNA polymerase III subunit gamma/tau n=1 Tax=Marinomonas posidonica (strain CECT 7376 / NCIMB 14433 / IVIA-Po-181) TaxID=491952 RepID=F6CYF4_MARPP|nr:DNA polymerase III subunit gamma/tau [Marinomonas posidonica]AEF54563.1 DNA polymerase III, subunits gamma and tau [Marinomonas posidonica IVIA-Po-181]
MSYQVLARKWRPQTFLEMAGQDHVLQALVNALRQQRLHHAYLFTGTRGVGKTTIARIFAKCLNCEINGISPEPCGTCDSCREIAEGRFVDLIEVDAASRTKVEDTRELLENVQYAPTRGRFKVYLIDEVHMLSTHSFNALLKTLEEPPEHVKFLLATTDPQKLPVTILSRCLQFNLKNMSPQRVVDYLQTVLTTEQVPFDQPALWQIGQAANGSMRDALSLTDQAIAFGDGGISESGVTAMLGLVNQAQILDLLERIASKNAADVLSRIEALADYQPDFVAICGSLLDTLHRVAIEQQVPGALADQLGDLAQIQNIAKTVSPEEIQVMYQSLLVGRRDLHLAHSARAGFEMLMLRMIAFRPAPPMTVSHQMPPTVAMEKKTPDVGPNSTSENTLDPAAEAEADVAGMTSANGLADAEDQRQSDHIQAKQAAPIQTSSPSTELSADERPPWEEAPADETIDETVDDNIAPAAQSQAVQPQAVQQADSMLEPIAASENSESAASDVESSDLSRSEVDASTVMTRESERPVEHSTEAPKADVESVVDLDSGQDDRKMSERAVARVESLLEASHNASESIDDDEEEDEEEAEERAIADVADPFNPAADLVEALASEVIEAEPESAEKDSSDPRLAKVPDTIAQPALGMPLPELNHYNELTMQIWWLVAPRLPLRGLVQNILMNSSMVDASDQGIRLQVPLEYGHMLNQVRYEQIQGALGDFFAMPVPLIIDTVEETEGVTAEEFAASKRAEALQVAIQHLNSHPVVQALSSTMGAQLVYDSVKVKA